jgi:ABC-type transporter Mla subunit MlaD
MQARLASVEGLADQLDGGLETVAGVSDQIGAMLTAGERLTLPLDEVPEPVRSTLEPVVAALEEAKAAMLDPLRGLQATLAELQPQLELVARAAHETLDLLTESIGRVADAAAHCDDVADFVHDVATLSLGGEDAGSIESALADWQTLGPQIADARTAL